MADVPFKLFGSIEVPPDPAAETVSITVTQWLPSGAEPEEITNSTDTPMTIFAHHDDGGGKVVLQPGERCVWPAPKDE